MRLLGMAIWLVILASPCAAQSIGGVEIGMPESSALNAIGGKSFSFPENPSRRMVLGSSGDLIAGICDGVVFSVQEEIGTSFYDFASEVNSNIREFGTPVYTIRDIRSRKGKGASITASWKRGELFWETDIFEIEEVKSLQVSRRIRKDSSCDQ